MGIHTYAIVVISVWIPFMCEVWGHQQPRLTFIVRGSTPAGTISIRFRFEGTVR